MSTDARNSLIAWGSVLAFFGFGWLALSLDLLPDMPRWAEPYFWSLIGALLVFKVIRLFWSKDRRRAEG